MIGDLPDTMKDRAIPVRMRRKIAGEIVAPMTLDFDDDNLDVRRKCRRWCEDNSFIGVNPDSPDVGNDRASDNWKPLLAIADRAGDHWPQSARNAMANLESDGINDAASIGQKLLTDIKSIFDTRQCEKISSELLVSVLVGMPEQPWCEWRRGRPMTQNSLARLLKPYGISSTQIRFPDSNKKGYYRSAFDDSFKSYVDEGYIGSQSETTKQTKGSRGLRPISKRNSKEDVSLQNRVKPSGSKGCFVVSVQEGGNPESHKRSDNYSDYEEF